MGGPVAGGEMRPLRGELYDLLDAVLPDYQSLSPRFLFWLDEATRQT